MRNFYQFDPGLESPEIVRMLVEIPKNSNHKFEFDPAHGVFRLSRTLYSPIHSPGDYGFIPGAVAEVATRSIFFAWSMRPTIRAS
ncbi:MAG TPA: inorganic diphosphatase [Bryobacteraceae bacterium]|nr:inorganic diphosphatase [Bryobacteraceae bacterium]